MLPVMDVMSTYEQALRAERKEKFAEAYALFLACVGHPDCDAGEISFHAGWCLEQLPHGDRNEVVRLYHKAAEAAATPSCKMNSLFRAGWVLMQAKEHAKAADLFRQTIEYCAFVGMETETYHQAMFWYAVCLEARSWYLDALKWYRCVESLASSLHPESRYRQIICLNQIGLYEEAINVCHSFERPAPTGFNSGRYGELQSLARHERDLLQACLHPALRKGAVSHVGC